MAQDRLTEGQNMRLFSCKVRLSNSLYNEVPKINVTAPEITILRYIHGGGGGPEQALPDTASVTDIKATGNVDRTSEAERARLQALYGAALKKKDVTMGSLFGVGIPLPDTIDGVGDGGSVVEPVIKRSPGRPRKEVEPETETAAAFG
jgi:hypothetical protein